MLICRAIPSPTACFITHQRCMPNNVVSRERLRASIISTTSTAQYPGFLPPSNLSVLMFFCTPTFRSHSPRRVSVHDVVACRKRPSSQMRNDGFGCPRTVFSSHPSMAVDNKDRTYGTSMHTCNAPRLQEAILIGTRGHVRTQQANISRR